MMTVRIHGRNTSWSPLCLFVLMLLAGCSQAKSELNEPMGYKTHEALKERLLEVAKYGDGGSSLGGIPESIDLLLKEEPEKGKKLLADFQKLNTTNSKEERKKIAKAMADQL